MSKTKKSTWRSKCKMILFYPISEWVCNEDEKETNTPAQTLLLDRSYWI